MADKNKYIDDLIDAGATDDEIAEALQMATARGDFAEQPKQTSQPESVQQQQEQQEPSYGQRIGQYWTKDLPEAGKGLWDRTRERAARIEAPTTLGGMAQSATGLNSIPGQIVESVAGTPERFVRTVAGAAGTIGDVIGSALGLGAKAVDNATGGYAGKIVKPVADNVADVVAGNKTVQQVASWYDNLSPAEKANYGSALDLTEIVGYGGGKVANAALKKIPETLQDAAFRISSTLTGVDDDALKLLGQKAGRESLKAAYGQQAAIGGELVDVIDNAYANMPDYAKIDNALRKSPGVNVVPFISKLQKVAGNPNTAEMKAVSDKLLQKSEEIRQLAANSGNSGYVNAADLLEYRKEIDNIINDGFGKESNRYVTVLKDVRHDMKEALVNSAKGTEYEPTMKELSIKLDALDRIKALLGKNSDTRELRAESFIRNINNKGKTEAKKWLSDFETLFGGDFVKQSQLARFAEMVGDEGKGDWFPRWTTGKSLLGNELLGKAAGFAVGSPKIAGKVTLPTIGALTAGTTAVADATKQISGPVGVGLAANIRNRNKKVYNIGDVLKGGD